MSRSQVIDEAEGIVVRRGAGNATPACTEPELLRAGQILLSSMRSMQACLRWACTIVIGRGGWDLGDLQRVYASAGRGENWEALRDQLAKARHRG